MGNFKKKFIRNTQIGNIIGTIYYWINIRMVPEKIYTIRRHKKRMGKSPNLQNPKTLNEKIVWLKLNDRTPLHTKCADKYAVREYVSEKIGEEYLIPLYYHTVESKNITPENLPDTPYIIKTNHDSGGGIFVYDKSKVHWKEVQRNLKNRLKINYYWESKEWQYKNIKPRIIVEKLLLTKENKVPFDYKMHCFNGKVITIQVDMDRGTDNHYRNWYDTNWNREPFKWAFIKENGKKTDPSDFDVEKPSTLEEMIRLSEKLASPFCYARVDWYDVDGRLFFGEITFHHDGGNSPIEPEEWDVKLGEKLILEKLIS